jgi:hypothetical protein
MATMTSLASISARGRRDRDARGREQRGASSRPIAFYLVTDTAARGKPLIPARRGASVPPAIASSPILRDRHAPTR